MCSLIRSRADWTEERFKGSVLESAIVCIPVSGSLGFLALSDHLSLIFGSATLDDRL